MDWLVFNSENFKILKKTKMTNCRNEDKIDKYLRN